MIEDRCAQTGTREAEPGGMTNGYGAIDTLRAFRPS